MVKQLRRYSNALWISCLSLLMVASLSNISSVEAADAKRKLGVKAQANGVVRYKQARSTKPSPKRGGRIMVPVTSTGIVRYQSKCPAGSERIGEKCVKACPPAMYRYRSKCLCPDGLKKRGNECIEIAAPPPAPPPADIEIAPPKFLAGQVGQEYPETTLVATGGRRPYVFQHVDGALPPGIELSKRGRISGTPTKRGTFAFVIEAVDRNKAIGERSYSIVVEGCKEPQIYRDGICVNPPKITLSPAELPGGELKSKYSGGQLKGSGGSRPYIFEIAKGELPPGLKLSDLGAWSGTPTKTGEFTFSVKAYDAQDFEGVRRYTIKVSEAKKEPEEKDEIDPCPPNMVRFGANCIPDKTTVISQPPKKPDIPPITPKRPVNDEDDYKDDDRSKGRELVFALQNQLSRLGCLRGRVDGIWGSGSRSALSRFLSKARLSRIDRREPTWAAVSAARKKPRGYCQGGATPRPKPTPCKRGFYRNDYGKCVRECRRGFYLARNGKCVRERPKPRPCEPNAFRNDEGDCVCRSKFVYRGGRCVRDRKPPVLIVCGDNQVMRNGECYTIRCNPNYVARRGKCVPRRRPPVLIVCGDNEVMRNRKCYPIRCNPGFVPRQGRCVPIRCKRGQVLQGGRCVRVQPKCVGGQYLDRERGVCRCEGTRVFDRRLRRCVSRPIRCNRGFVARNDRCVRVQPKCVGGQYLDRKRGVCRCEGTRVFDRRLRRCVSRQQQQQRQPQQRQQRGGNNRQQREARCLAICRPRFVLCMRQTNNNRPLCMQQAKQCVRAAGCR